MQDIASLRLPKYTPLLSLKYKRKGLVGTPRLESLCKDGAGVRLAALLLIEMVEVAGVEPEALIFYVFVKCM